MTIRARRVVAAGALAVAAVAAPLAMSLTTAGHALAGPQCLSWYGNRDDGVCLGYSNGNPTSIGTPFGVYGPNGGTGVGGFNGGSVVSGPLLPGQTWSSSN